MRAPGPATAGGSGQGPACYLPLGRREAPAGGSQDRLPSLQKRSRGMGSGAGWATAQRGWEHGDGTGGKSAPLFVGTAACSVYEAAGRAAPEQEAQ